MDYIMTVAQLRAALKGVSGDKEIRIRMPFQGKGYYNPLIKKVEYNKDWKCYMILTDSVD